MPTVRASVGGQQCVVGYSTSDSAALTIGGVSSTFSLTTGAQPVLQGALTPVTGVAPASIQTSTVIEVTGTTITLPISIVGGTYSVNGAPFTAAAGTVQPGDQLLVQLTAAPTYNTTSSAIVSVGGVNSAFSVTTGAQPPPQGDFIPVTGSSLGVLRLSNAMTITSLLAAAPISVNGGAQYRINGGPFTAGAGIVQPGDQVVVQITAPSNYVSTATAVLTIGASSSDFAVTTGAQPVLQGGFTPVTGSAVSGRQTSNPITVTGINSPAVISITGGEYSINDGPYSSAPGTVQPGDLVKVQMLASPTYSTTAKATLRVNGVSTDFSVTTSSQPLNVGVTGGGGSLSLTASLVLALLALRRAVNVHRTGVLVSGLALLIGLSPIRVRADEGDWLPHFYGGIRAGASTSSMTASTLTRELQAQGYEVTAAGAERGTAAGAFFLGYELSQHFAVELASLYVGRTRAAVAGVQSTQLEPLLNDAARIVRGSGDIIALEARYRWPLARIIDLDLRAGPYLWITKADVYVDGTQQLQRTDTGVGYSLGVNPRVALGEHLAVELAADVLRSTSDTHFVLFSATLEYHCR